MIKKYNNHSLLFGAPGLVLYSCWGFSIANPLFRLAGLLGSILLIIALVYYAKSKGRNPVWGVVGILGIVGVIILYFLKDLTTTSDVKNIQGETSMLKVIIGIVLIVIFLVIIYRFLVIEFGGG